MELRSGLVFGINVGLERVHPAGPRSFARKDSTEAVADNAGELPAGLVGSKVGAQIERWCVQGRARPLSFSQEDFSPRGNLFKRESALPDHLQSSRAQLGSSRDGAHLMQVEQKIVAALESQRAQVGHAAFEIQRRTF